MGRPPPAAAQEALRAQAQALRALAGHVEDGQTVGSGTVLDLRGPPEAPGVDLRWVTRVRETVAEPERVVG